ncbi:MAG: hypothetical protein VX871_12250 [Pseudomonadota bacterium]|nr:hypothetical protein [Pseudomonadota bacterium]
MCADPRLRGQLLAELRNELAASRQRWRIDRPSRVLGRPALLMPAAVLLLAAIFIF